MSNIYLDNRTLRQEASRLTDSNRGRLFLLSLTMFGVSVAITAVISLLLVLIAKVAGSATVSQTSYYSYSNDYMSQLATQSATQSLLNSLSSLLSVASSLLLAPITLGFHKAHIDLCRGGEARVGTLFSRIRNMFDAFGLTILIGLKVFLWMLPGLGAMIALMVLAVMTELEALIVLGFIGGLALMLGLAIPKALSYSLAMFIMADDPTVGVSGSIRRSKALMVGRRWQYFKLTIPYLLTVFGVYFAVGLVSGLLAALLKTAGLMIALVLILGLLVWVVLYSLRITVAYALFYTELTKAAPTGAPLIPGDKSDETLRIYDNSKP